MVRLSEPFGPLTVMWRPSTATVTPVGSGTGIFPIRLISPNLTYDFAAQTTTASLTIGEQALGSGNDDDAQATLDSGQFTGRGIDAVSWFGYPPDALDSREALPTVTEPDLQLPLRPFALHLEAVDIALGGEDARDALLEPGSRHDRFLASHHGGVAHPGEHVGDGIVHHGYHEAFLTPGNSPREASCRTQMRHIPKSRRYARARPHRWQRE